MKGETVKDQGFSFRGKCLSDIIMLLVFLVNKKTLCHKTKDVIGMY